MRRADLRYPGDVWINYDLARALEKLARRDDAIRYYSAARAIRPETAHELAHALRDKGEQNEEIAILAAAEAANREAVRLRPDFPNAHNTLGDILFHVKQDYAAAAAAFREAARLQPDNALFHNNLGLALQQQGEFDQAIGEYRAAISLKPDFADPHLGLGEVLEIKGKPVEALVEYRTAILIQPSSADAHNRLAWALALKPDRSASERSEALEHARQAVAFDPKEASYRTTLALAEYRAGHWAEAIASAEQSIALAKDVDASNGFCLAMALWQQGVKGRSRSCFDQAVSWTKKNDPRNANLLALWREAALPLGQPGPSAAEPLPDLPAEPFAP